MKRFGMEQRDVIRKGYRIFKGYSVKVKNTTESMEQHYVVPWEMGHQECKKYEARSLV